MTKIAGLTYVNEFTFSKEQGFTGSAGVHSVKGYQRGGRVKKEAPPVAAAEGGSIHAQLRAEGGRLGFAYGGRVKNTSSEFVAKKGPMPSMDSATDPGRPANQAEKETGGRKRTLPGMGHGGKVHHVRDTPRGRITDKDSQMAKRLASQKGKKGKPRGKIIPSEVRAAKRGMPKNVKAQGGLAQYSGC